MALKSFVLKITSTNKAVRLISAACNKNYSVFSGDADRKTHFGFETVNENEKAGKVHEVFESVAENYDVMNDAMSLGIHRIWKDQFVEKLAPMHGTKLLDVAGGTGDIAFRYIKYLKSLPQYLDKREVEQSHVTILDINQAMLDQGMKKAEKLGLLSDKSIDIKFVCGDAENLPFPDESFSAYTIAFGIRNCTHPMKVIDEAYRVLEPGGRFMCLEFSRVQPEKLRWAYDKYSFQVIPVMGQLIAGQYKPYKYLVESIRKFPSQDTFKVMIENSGFRVVQYENLTFGVCSIHSGYKL